MLGLHFDILLIGHKFCSMFIMQSELKQIKTNFKLS